MRCALTLIVGLAALVPSHVCARGTVVSMPWFLVSRERDEQAIRALIDASTEAWNAGNASGYSAHFASDATFTGITGATSVGQKAFEAQQLELLASALRGSHLRQTVALVRFVARDAVVVDIDRELTGFATLPAGVKAGPDKVLRTRLQVVFVRNTNQWNQWSMVSYHEVDVKTPDSRT